MLDMVLFPGLPFVANDMIQSIVDFVLIKISRSADDILVVKTKIKLEEHNCNGEFILMLDDASLTKLLAKLKDKFGI
jgi:chemotaxis protein CheY-P-specific phosphatase CheC